MRLSGKHLLLLFGFVLVTTLNHRVNAAPTCNKAYSDNPAYSTFSSSFLHIKNDSPWSANFNVSIPTVKADTRISTSRGDLIVLERIHTHWATVYSADSINYQGDPRWFANMVGAKVAGHFGFFQYSDKALLGPTADYANKAVARINQKVNPEDQIHIRFRETGDTALSDIEYLQDFRKGLIPIAEKGYYSIHDLSYHFVSVFYPKRVLDIANTRVDLTLGFRKWVEKISAKDIHIRGLLRDVANAEITRRTKWLDSSSGSLAYMMAMRLVDPHNPEFANSQKYILNTLFAQNKTAVEELRSLLLQKLEQNKAHPKADRERAKALIHDYLTTITDPIYHAKHEIKIDDFFAEIEAKIQAWKQALLGTKQN